MAFVFSGGLTVLKVIHFLPLSPDACRNGRPIALYAFFCQAEGGGQKGNSAASETTAVNLDFILHGGSTCLGVKHMQGDKDSICIGVNQYGGKTVHQDSICAGVNFFGSQMYRSEMSVHVFRYCDSQYRYEVPHYLRL